MAVPFEKPGKDRWGFPTTRDGMPAHYGDWEERHQLLGMPNDLVPKGIRTFFSRPQSEAELKVDLATSKSLKNTTSLLERIELGDLPDKPRSPLTADAGAPVCPERHVPGGNMLDRDGLNRNWNTRWHTGISLLNDSCHPDHRSYFTQRSLFERSPSQQYRRYLHQEKKPGDWVSIDQRRAPRFLPLGGLLRGRSGTPIPGATP